MFIRNWSRGERVRVTQAHKLSPEKLGLLHIVESCCPVIPPEKPKKEADRSLVRKTQKANGIFKPFDDQIEKTADLAEPDEEAGQDKQGKDLFEVPVHPAVGLDKNVGALGKP
jgi:hypothetical protein